MYVSFWTVKINEPIPPFLFYVSIYSLNFPCCRLITRLALFAPVKGSGQRRVMWRTGIYVETTSLQNNEVSVFKKYRVRYFRGRVSSLNNQSEARKQCLIPYSTPYHKISISENFY